MHMENSNKKNIGITLISIAMILLVLGILLFDSIKWLKDSFLIISVIISAIALVLQLVNNTNGKDK